MAAFRETYSELHELRSLAPSVKMIALTFTATSSTRKAITEILMMENQHVIYENPGKVNIAYSVHYMEKEKSVEDYFQWLVDEIKETKTKATRTIIYCQTINNVAYFTLPLKECWATIYMLMALMIQERLSLKCCIPVHQIATRKLF